MDHKTFAEKVCGACGIDIASFNLLSGSMIEVIQEAVMAGDVVSVPSFGNFEPRKRNERVMSHPSSPGKRLLIPPKMVLNFKPSAILKARMKDGEGK